MSSPDIPMMEECSSLDTEDPHGTCHLCLQESRVIHTVLLRCVADCAVCVCESCEPKAIGFGKCMFCHAAIDSVLDPLSKKPVGAPMSHPALPCVYAGLLSLLVHLYTLYAVRDI